MTYRNSRNFCNDETNLDAYKFNYETSETANESTRIPRIVKKVIYLVRYIQELNIELLQFLHTKCYFINAKNDVKQGKRLFNKQEK